MLKGSAGGARQGRNVSNAMNHISGVASSGLGPQIRWRVPACVNVADQARRDSMEAKLRYANVTGQEPEAQRSRIRGVMAAIYINK
jgi:hypothetical protein